jgi:hypothetical protein
MHLPNTSNPLKLLYQFKTGRKYQAQINNLNRAIDISSPGLTVFLLL